MIDLKWIGKGADDLRFFIRLDGAHAGGITVYSTCTPRFSYGIAVAPHLRRQGVAKAALPLLFAEMKRRGWTRAVVQVAQDNAASLALHRALGFSPIAKDENTVTLALDL
ncbi:MAG: GNAT family N-acetyltransferase [Christensenellales bacterium]|nr:GNAT family N-acetyltransferase [Christensenellales bacterium]